MIILDCEQRDEVWAEARFSIPTASQFSRIVTTGGKISTQSDEYMNELLAGYITGQAEETYTNFWMKRGVELEPVARGFYEFLVDAEVENVGFVFKDERFLTGCSPDGLIRSGNGGLEIKCPKASNQIKYLLEQDVPDNYKPQIYGSLWITDKEYWDWLSYHPSLPHVLVRVYRDEKYIKALESAVSVFIDQMLTKRQELIERGITRIGSNGNFNLKIEDLE